MTDTVEERARKRFEGDTAEHEMTVMRDDELYRHLRFKAPGTITYYYDLVTWPGYLAIVGDMGDYLFSRTRDMFEFFEGDGKRINPHYWAEKLQSGPSPGRSGAMVYSHDALRSHVLDWARDYCEYGGGDVMYPSLLVAALEREILSGHTLHPEEARERIDRLEEAVGYVEAWEWDLREYDQHFLWCCWAILRGIGQYRTKEQT